MDEVKEWLDLREMEVSDQTFRMDTMDLIMELRGQNKFTDCGDAELTVIIDEWKSN